MKVRDLLTPESLDAFARLRSASTPQGMDLMSDYRELRAQTLEAYPAVAQWVTLMENFQFDEAREPGLLQALHRDSFMRVGSQTQRDTSLVIDYDIISPRVCVFRRK